MVWDFKHGLTGCYPQLRGCQWLAARDCTSMRAHAAPAPSRMRNSIRGRRTGGWRIRTTAAWTSSPGTSTSSTAMRSGWMTTLARCSRAREGYGF